jgi:hypothetical protein
MVDMHRATGHARAGRPSLCLVRERTPSTAMERENRADRLPGNLRTGGTGGLVPLTAGVPVRHPESSHQNCAQTGFSAQPEGVASEPVQRGSSPLAGHNDGSGQGPPSSSGRLELLAAFGLPGLGPGGPGSGVWAASAPPGWFGRARHAVGPDTTKPRIASRRPGQPAGLAGGRSSGDRAAWSATAWRCPSGRGGGSIPWLSLVPRG